MRIGTDIIEISRIKKAIENNGNLFLDRIFSKQEQEYCEKKKNMKFQHYAGKFAAKEAVFKAVSGIIEINNWTDIEILNNENGKPNVLISKKNLNLDISISHCKEYATAVAIFQ